MSAKQLLTCITNPNEPLRPKKWKHLDIFVEEPHKNVTHCMSTERPSSSINKCNAASTHSLEMPLSRDVVCAQQTALHGGLFTVFWPFSLSCPIFTRCQVDMTLRQGELSARWQTAEEEEVWLVSTRGQRRGRGDEPQGHKTNWPALCAQLFRVLERSDAPSMLDNLPGDLGCPSVSCLRSDFDFKVCLCGNFCNIPCLLTLFWIRPPIKNKTGFYDSGCMFEPIFTSVEYNCDCPYDIKLY